MTLLTLLFVRLLLVLLAILVLSFGSFCILRGLDRLVGVSFKEVIKGIKEDPKASAIYYGLRLLGVYIAMGLLVCVVFLI